MYPISLCMIVRNECDSIERCLDSISEYVQEIVVVDTGSNDSTKEIINNYKVSIYDYVWNDSFSDARNYALSKATLPFILVMDADEIFDEKSIPELRKFCESSSDIVGKVNINNQEMDRTISRTQISRIFPNNGNYMYRGRVHEQIMFKDGGEPITCSTGINLYHYGYSKDAIASKSKINRNIILLESELNDHPHNPYLWYQMGRTQYVNKEYINARVSFQHAIDILVIAKEHPGYLPSLLITYAYTLFNLRAFEELFTIIDTTIEMYPDFTDIYFIYGIALMELKDVRYLNRIKEAFDYCIRLGDASPSKYETVLGVGSFKAYYNLGVYFEVLGHQKNAITNYQEAAKFGYQPAINRLSLLSKM